MSRIAGLCRQLSRRRTSSYFFGLVSDDPPVLRNISVHTDSGWVTVTGYAPQLP